MYHHENSQSDKCIMTCAFPYPLMKLDDYFQCCHFFLNYYVKLLFLKESILLFFLFYYKMQDTTQDFILLGFMT